MESGTPVLKATEDGWLNRLCTRCRSLLMSHNSGSVRAIAMGPTLPRIFPARASGGGEPINDFGIAAGNPKATPAANTF